jgi:NADH dehydrogenase
VQTSRIDALAGTGRTVLVLGGTGFIGRHAVAALLRAGCTVIVGSRHPKCVAQRIPELAEHCANRSARFERLLEPQAWGPLLDGIDCVVNCVGILRQRGRETYRRVHHLALAALAESCRMHGLRLIHVSALGLRADSRSRFLCSKLDGENALRASGADWCLVRPSLLDGEGGYGAKWLRRVARWPVHVLPADARGRIAALDVGELGEALAALALRSWLDDTAKNDRLFELGGVDRYTLAEYVAAIRRRHTQTPARCLSLPALVARLGSHLCDLLHVTPFSFGHWELLQRDNCPQLNRLPELLGRMPRAVGVGADLGAENGSDPLPALRRLHPEPRM